MKRSMLLTLVAVAWGFSQSPQAPSTASLTPPSAPAANVTGYLLDHYNNNPVHPLTLQGGEPLWTRSLTKEGFKTYHPTFLPDQILLGDAERLVVMNSGSGAFDWEHRFERDLDHFIANDGVLYYSDHRHGVGPFGWKAWLHAYAMKDSKELWSVDSTGGGDLYYFDGHVYHYTVSLTGSATLHSYDRSGKQEWEFKTKGEGRLFFMEDVVVTVPPGEKALIALKRKDGTPAWKVSLEQDSYEMALKDGVLYSTRRSYNPLNLPGGTITVAAFDPKSGKPLWKFTTPADDGWFTEMVGGIVTDGRYCILNTNRHLFGIDAKTGKQLWSLDPEEKQSFLQAKPIILGTEVFAVQVRKNKQSILQCLDLGTGREKVRVEVADEVVPPAKVVGQTLFLCFRHGDMLALPLKPVDAQVPQEGTVPAPK